MGPTASKEVLNESHVPGGFRMPAEWEPHKQTWMGWPYTPFNWRNHAKPAQDAYARVAEAIAQFEPVTVCAHPNQWLEARKRLPSHIRVVEMGLDDAWYRDTGPTFVSSGGEVRAVHWGFNAYGNKYFPTRNGCVNDRWNGAKIASMERLHMHGRPMVLEGGSIHVDGEGTLLTTEECVLNSNRNPDMNKAQIESELSRSLGISKVIWLPRGLYADDDTNGHIDNFACFSAPGKVLLSWSDDKSDPQYDISREAEEVLQRSTDARGRKIEVIKLPVPPPMYRTKEDVPMPWLAALGGAALLGMRRAGTRLAGSYMNFYVCNGGVVMPSLGHAASEAAAVKVLESSFPGRRVVPVASREILLGGGNIHCITCQQPAAEAAPGGK